MPLPDAEAVPKVMIEAISCTLQQGLADWNPNPLVPKAFQYPVESAALTQAITDIAVLARSPLEEMIHVQQEQIQQLQKQIERLEQVALSSGGPAVEQEYHLYKNTVDDKQ